MSKRKEKQKQRRAEKRAKRTQVSTATPAENLLARIALERRIRLEQSSQRFKDEQERLWLAEERQKARQRVRAKAKG